MARSVTKTNAQKQEVLMGLLTGRTVVAIAEEVGVSPRTIFRWLNNRDFQVEWQAAVKGLGNYVFGHLQTSAFTCIETLREIMTNPDNTPELRSITASKLLETLLNRSLIEPVVPPEPTEDQDYSSLSDEEFLEIGMRLIEGKKEVKSLMEKKPRGLNSHVPKCPTKN